MAKSPTPNAAATDLTVREHVLHFCVASGTDWQRADVTGEVVTNMIVKNLVARDALGWLALTHRGRAVIGFMLPD